MEHPNRSDVHLTQEEAAKLEADTRHYYDEAAPKRHTKPQRSDYSSAYSDALADSDSNAAIPEHLQFQRLEKDDNQKLDYVGGRVGEEFTETEYYKDLSVIDKQHHTTGTGFIRVDNSSGANGGFTLAPDSAAESHHHASSRGNPATNDWIPDTNADKDFMYNSPASTLMDSIASKIQLQKAFAELERHHSQFEMETA